LGLAGATFAGYTLAFAHEAGYASYFGVPLDLVSLDITRILVVTGGLLELAWVLFTVFSPMSAIFKSERLPEPLRERLGYLALPSVLVVAFLYLYGLHWTGLGLAVAVIAFVLSVEFLLPLITQRKTRGYLAKLAAVGGNRPQEPPSPLVLSVLRVLGRQRFILLLWLGFAVYMAYSSGQADATKREWFYCPSDSPDVVVVRIYGSAVVGAKYDPRSHRLVGELALGTRGEGRSADLKWRKVGPLAPFAPEAAKDHG